MESPFASTAELADFMDIEVNELPAGASLVLLLVSALIALEAPGVADLELDTSKAEVVRGCCLQATTRILNSNPGISSESSGSASVSYDSDGGRGFELTQSERSSLNGIRASAGQLNTSTWRP